MFQWFWIIIKWEHTKTNLILGVPEPQGSVDDHEEEGEDDSREKDEDAAELVKRNWIFFNLKKIKLNLVNHEDAEADGGNHHHRWVGLLQGFHLNLWMVVDLK